MKVRILKEWIAVPGKVGKVVDLPEDIAKGGIERGVCEVPGKIPSDAEQLAALQEENAQLKARVAELEQAAAPAAPETPAVKPLDKMTKAELLTKIQELPDGTKKLEALALKLKARNPREIRNADLVALIEGDQE